MNTVEEFITKRLTPTPEGSHFVSLFVTDKDTNGMEIVNIIKSKGQMCQTLSGDQVEKIGAAKLFDIVNTFFKVGVVVLITCKDQDQLLSMYTDLMGWQQTASQAGHSDNKGRLFVLLNNTNVSDLSPNLQHVFDYTCRMN